MQIEYQRKVVNLREVFGHKVRKLSYLQPDAETTTRRYSTAAGYLGILPDAQNSVRVKNRGRMVKLVAYRSDEGNIAVEEASVFNAAYRAGKKPTIIARGNIFELMKKLEDLGHMDLPIDPSVH